MNHGLGEHHDASYGVAPIVSQILVYHKMILCEKPQQQQKSKHSLFPRLF